MISVGAALFLQTLRQLHTYRVTKPELPAPARNTRNVFDASTEQPAPRGLFHARSFPMTLSEIRRSAIEPALLLLAARRLDTRCLITIQFAHERHRPFQRT
jgi:hypothetical protein